MIPKTVIVLAAVLGCYLCVRILRKMNQTLDQTAGTRDGSTDDMDLSRRELLKIIDALRRENAKLRGRLDQYPEKIKDV